FRVTPHSESSLITALLLFFILQPSSDPVTLLQLALAGLFASASKYVLAYRGRHIFNPAAVGAVWLTLFHFYLALWWVGTAILVPFTVVLALLVLYRTRRMPVGLVFAGLATAILVGRNVFDGGTVGTALTFALTQTPLIFLAGFMLSEPLTLPPARWQQLSVAALVAVLFAVPITIGSFLIGPEAALIAGNLLAFCFGQRKGIQLVVTGKRNLTPTTVEFVFRPQRSLRFAPGQYLELTVPHRSVDSRGTRRVFSISSAPESSGAVKIGVKMAEKGSSFKRALAELDVGGTVQATGISGDFQLPRNQRRPVLLIAGGIGITPFISQLAAMDTQGLRDAVLIYAAGDPAEIGYLEALQQSAARIVVVTATAADHLPGSFENVIAQRLDREMLARLVGDIPERNVYISGPPAFVNQLGAAAKSLKARHVSKDYFSGY
ncbi:MAG: FAD-binding oxidoreductase, partial [Nakamurella sp.]